MRRFGALLFAIVGYSTMALASADAATLPAGLAFVCGAFLLARDGRPRDEAERVALELLNRR